MQSSFIGIRKNTARFDDVFGTGRLPRDLVGVPHREDRDLLMINNEGFIVLLVNRSLEFTVCGVEFQAIDHIFNIHEWLVDRHHGHLGVGQRGPKDQATNAAKAVDANWHRNRMRFHV